MYLSFESMPGLLAEIRPGRIRLSGINECEQEIDRIFRPGEPAACGFDGDFLVDSIERIRPTGVAFTGGSVLTTANFAFFNQFRPVGEGNGRPARVCRECGGNAVRLYQGETCRGCLLASFRRCRSLLDAARAGRG